MSLSALNSGLSTANNSVSTEVNDLGGALSRPSSGTQSGEDFAAFLRHQIASLQSPQRQEIAAQSTPSLPIAPIVPPKASVTSGMLEQQALRQAFHPGKYLHGKAPSSKGMGTLSPGGHYAKQLPPKPEPEPAPDKVNAAPHTQTPSQQAAQEAPPAHEAEQDSTTQAKPRPSGHKQLLADAKDMVGQDGQALQSIALSPEVEIITVAQPATSEKSLTDFALAMGLDPSQIQALLGDAAAANVSASLATTTQQMLAMNPFGNSVQVALGAEGVALPVNSVLAQALPVAPNLSAMAASVNPLLTSPEMPALTPIGLQVQWSSASADLAADTNLGNLQNLNVAVTTQVTETTENISTLAVLSMMDADLRPEDIDRLNEEFDKLSASDDGDSSSHEGLANSGLGINRSNGLGHTNPAQVLKTHSDMAQTFEKLSQKLATEMASRMNDQLNAGEWKMKFALKPASLGLVDVQLEMRDGQLHAQFDADNALTQNLIQNGSTRLKEALAELGMNNAYVSVGQDNRQSSQSGSGQSGQRQAASDNRVTLGADGAGETVNSATPSRHSNSALLDTFV
ncbi:MAG: flagellar hook-length control protein FliK [Burkholderiales bacterium]|nr:flagellar hook-length control protein FliK [Burkholderiales bacterium]